MASIRIEVRLYSILKQYGREHGLGDRFTLDVEEGTTLDQIIEKIGIPPRRVGRYVKEGQTMQPDQAPADGDVIDVLPPTIGGG